MQNAIIFDQNTDVNFTSLRDYLEHPYSFEEAVARLYALAGWNIFDLCDQYKTTFEVCGTFNGEVFTLYDYKEDNKIHIGGRESLDTIGLQKVLLELMDNATPKEYTASYHYGSEGGYSWYNPQ
ncbi:putative ORFan [Tupanvirus deep ocean]|uniref:ORFan n=2 Tax=Tupanvirus TaxID=2094720 RepID=A0AC62A9W4_9VIRU|nr:putative ORFan [Tupanvirus deep ocean]QKU34559.1 putative ORFan [Tupanvirus deep ocean]